MNVEITSRGDGIPSALREYAKTRLAGMERLGEEFERGQVILSTEREEMICEVILHRHRGDPFVAQERAREGRACVDGAAAKLEKQFVRFKEKHSHKGKRHRLPADDQTP